MKQSIYHRIPTIATADLQELCRLWTGLCETRPTPRRHDYWGKCLLRATLILEGRQALPHRSAKNRTKPL